jgi:hypothetical protein
MSCIGGLGRFFETARTALPGKAPQTNKIQKKIKKITIINKKSQMNQR